MPLRTMSCMMSELSSSAMMYPPPRDTAGARPSFSNSAVALAIARFISCTRRLSKATSCAGLTGLAMIRSALPSSDR